MWPLLRERTTGYRGRGIILSGWPRDNWRGTKCRDERRDRAAPGRVAGARDPGRGGRAARRRRGGALGLGRHRAGGAAGGRGGGLVRHLPARARALGVGCRHGILGGGADLVLLRGRPAGDLGDPHLLPRRGIRGVRASGARPRAAGHRAGSRGRPAAGAAGPDHQPEVRRRESRALQPGRRMQGQGNRTGPARPWRRPDPAGRDRDRRRLRHHRDGRRRRVAGPGGDGRRGARDPARGGPGGHPQSLRPRPRPRQG